MFDRLSDWLKWLEQQHPTEIELGLDRITEVASRLTLLPLSSQVITVAGTNGKGSTVCAIASLLSASSKSVATYTSPHLLHFNERITIDGQSVSDEALCRAFLVVYQALGEVSLTYFEFTTLAALVLFAEAKPDVVVLEVGLGGRLDAVNIVDADIAVVTNIALDHQSWLGDDRESIGAEKAGILRPAKPVVIGDSSPPQSLRDKVSAIAAEAYYIGEEFALQPQGERWCWRARHPNGAAVQWPALPAGVLHPNSWAMALQVALLCDSLPSFEQAAECLRHTHLPGRQTRATYQGLSLLLDVAHNSDATSALSDHISSQSEIGVQPTYVAVFAAMRDKPIAEMLSLLGDKISCWWFIDLPDNPRALPATDALSLFRSLALPGVAALAPDMLAALDEIKASALSTDKVLIFGSFFTVAEALKLQQISIDPV